MHPFSPTPNAFRTHAIHPGHAPLTKEKQMIVDNLYTSQCDYGNMDCRLARAFDWLRTNDLKSIKPDQFVTVDQKRIVAQIQAYTTITPEEGGFEAHRSFIDIQIVVSGCETIYWAPLAHLPKIKTPYNYDKDIVIFEDPEYCTPVRLHEGDFVVLFPTDGHKARCQVSGPAQVGKIVVKVSV